MSEQVAKVVPWDVPAIDGSGRGGLLTAGRLQALQKEAYDEAYARGHREGLAAGKLRQKNSRPGSQSCSTRSPSRSNSSTKWSSSNWSNSQWRLCVNCSAAKFVSSRPIS